MAAGKQGRKQAGQPKSVRASVSMPVDVYRTLEQLAKNKKVSVAWVMRDAAEKYVAGEWPLLALSRNS
jgi:predicted transcriptional regulator